MVNEKGENSWWILILSLSVLSFNHSCKGPERVFEEARANNTIEAYQKFLKKFPKNTKVMEAQYRILELANDPQQYEQYIRSAPYSPFAEDAFFALATISDVFEDYFLYLQGFPQGKFSAAAREKTDIISLQLSARKHSIPSYKKITEQPRDAALVAEVNRQLEALSKQRHPDLIDVKTIKLIQKETFPAGVVTPFHDWVEEMAEIAGLELVDDENQSTDLTLTIQALGAGLKKRYSHGGDLYTGARVSGNLSLGQKSRTLAKQNFSGYQQPPGLITYAEGADPGYQEAHQAPFSQAISRGNFHRKLIEMITEYFGLNVLKSIAKGEGSFELQSKTANLLVKMWLSGDPLVENVMTDYLAFEQLKQQAKRGGILRSAIKRGICPAAVDKKTKELWNETSYFDQLYFHTFFEENSVFNQELDSNINAMKYDQKNKYEQWQTWIQALDKKLEHY
jgi:hypothetical protein